MRNKAAIIVAKDLQECFKTDERACCGAPRDSATNDALSYIGRGKNTLERYFFGHFTPEAMGDYLAGPNHTLPTGGKCEILLTAWS